MYEGVDVATMNKINDEIEIHQSLGTEPDFDNMFEGFEDCEIMNECERMDDLETHLENKDQDYCHEYYVNELERIDEFANHIKQKLSRLLG